MNFDPSWFVLSDPQAVLDFPNIVVGQEYQDAQGITAQAASDAMDAAINANLDNGYNGPLTADVIAGWLGVPAPTPEFIAEAKAAAQGGTPHMATVVPGGAIDRYCKAHGLTPTEDETNIAGDKIAVCRTDKGVVVWFNGQAEADLLPFG